MSQLERARQLIALNHVNDNGDAQTREFVDALLTDRSARIERDAWLATENGQLRGDIVDVHRSGMSPGARRVVGWGVAALVVTSGITFLTLWFVGVTPAMHAMRVSLGVEPAPPRAGPSWVGPVMSFTALGPPKIIMAVNERFNFMPTAVDTGIGTRVSLRYVDGDFSRLEGEAQRAQALAIARFVWQLPSRPKGTDTITVRVERPRRTVGEVGLAWDHFFLPAELNGRKMD